MWGYQVCKYWLAFALCLLYHKAVNKADWRCGERWMGVIYIDGFSAMMMVRGCEKRWRDYVSHNGNIGELPWKSLWLLVFLATTYFLMIEADLVICSSSIKTKIKFVVYIHCNLNCVLWALIYCEYCKCLLPSVV